MYRLLQTLTVSLLALNALAASEEYEIDSSHTYPNFTVSHLGFPTMWGQFASTTGTLTTDREAARIAGTTTVAVPTRPA